MEDELKCYACKTALASANRSVYCVADMWRGGRPSRHLCGPCADAEPVLSTPEPSCETCKAALDPKRMNDPSAYKRFDLCVACFDAECVAQASAFRVELEIKTAAAAAIAENYELLKPTTLVWEEIIVETTVGLPTGSATSALIVQHATKERSEPVTPFGRTLRNVMVHSTADLRWWMTEHGDSCANFVEQPVSILEQVERLAVKHPEIIAKRAA